MSKKFSHLVKDSKIIFPDGLPKFSMYHPEHIISKIKLKMQELENQIDEGIMPYLEVPLRTRENIVYDKNGNLFYGNIKHKISFDDQYTEFRNTMSLINILYEVLSRDIHSTKRDLFYRDVNAFKYQKISDKLINIVATWLGCSRNSLNVTAASKGVVIGNISFTERGDQIDCRRVGHGKSITPNIDHIDNIQSDAEFILVVEKDAIFNRLAQDGFPLEHRCILITAKGQPDLGTRAFIKKLVSELKIPVFAVMDADVYGISILSTYANGSIQMAYETPRLCHNNTYWLGLRPSQLTEYGIDPEVQIPINFKDERLLQNMMNLPNYYNNQKVLAEIILMQETRIKAEIQALNAQDPHFISKIFLPQALDAGDFIKF